MAEARQAAGLSQSALALTLGRSQSWLSNIELNYRELGRADAERLATAIGVATDDLYEPVGTRFHWIGHPGEPPPLDPADLEPVLAVLSQLYPKERAQLLESFLRQARVRLEDARARPGRRNR